MPNMTNRDIKKVSELEEDYGSSDKWADALFEDFDFQAAYEAGHIYANDSTQKKLDKILKKVKPKDFKKYFTCNVFGVPSGFESRSERDDGLKKLSDKEAYFSDAYPEGGFDYSAFGFLPIDLDMVLENLKKDATKKKVVKK